MRDFDNCVTSVDLIPTYFFKAVSPPTDCTGCSAESLRENGRFCFLPLSGDRFGQQEVGVGCSSRSWPLWGTSNVFWTLTAMRTQKPPRTLQARWAALWPGKLRSNRAMWPSVATRCEIRKKSKETELQRLVYDKCWTFCWNRQKNKSHRTPTLHGSAKQNSRSC